MERCCYVLGQLSLCSREVEKFRCKMQISGITRRRRKTPSEQPRRAVAKKQCNKGGVLRCRRKPQSPSQSAPLFRVGCKCRALSVLFLRCERNQAIGLTPGRGTCPAGLSIAYRFDRCEPSLENPLSPDLRYRNQAFCRTECPRNPVPYRKQGSAVRNGAFGRHYIRCQRNPVTSCSRGR